VDKKIIEEKIRAYDKLKEECIILENEFGRIYSWEGMQKDRDQELSKAIKNYLENGTPLTEEQKEQMSNFNERYRQKDSKTLQNSIEYRQYRQEIENRINENGLFKSKSEGDKFIRRTLENAKKKQDYTGLAVFPEVRKEKIAEMNKLYSEISKGLSMMKEEDISQEIKDFEKEKIIDVSQIKPLGKVEYAWKTTKMVGNSILNRKIREGIVQLGIASDIQNIRKEIQQIQKEDGKIQEITKLSKEGEKKAKEPKSNKIPNNDLTI